MVNKTITEMENVDKIVDIMSIIYKIMLLQIDFHSTGYENRRPKVLIFGTNKALSKTRGIILYMAVNIEFIIEKLKDVISSELPDKKVFDKDVAAALGLSKESLSHLKKREAIPYEQIAFFCAKRKISINWILFDQLPKSLEEETEKYAKIKYFSNINASAGGGAFNFEENYELLSIDKVFLDSLYKTKQSNPSHVAALNVAGDSMEPTLNDREIILFDMAAVDIGKGGVYVVSTNAGLFVKRIAPKIDGSIELISDNKNYNSEQIGSEELSQLHLLGRVIGKFTLV